MIWRRLLNPFIITGLGLVAIGGVIGQSMLLFVGALVALLGAGSELVGAYRSGDFESIEQGLTPEERQDLAPIRAFRQKLRFWIKENAGDPKLVEVGERLADSTKRCHEKIVEGQLLRRSFGSGTEGRPASKSTSPLEVIQRLGREVADVNPHKGDITMLVKSSMFLVASLHAALATPLAESSPEEKARSISDLEAAIGKLDQTTEVLNQHTGA